MKTSITVTSTHQADSLWVVRDRVSFLGAVPGSSLSLLELEVPPGSGTPPHTHASPETFRVLSGEVTFGLFDEKPPRFAVAGPGAVVRIPSHAAHNYQNAGPVPATLLVLVDDSMVRFFRDLGKAQRPPEAPPAAAEIAAVMAACSRHGINLLAP